MMEKFNSSGEPWESVETPARSALDACKQPARPFRLRDGSQDLGRMLVAGCWSRIREIIYEGGGE